MSEEHAGFASARARLEDIAAQVRDKDTPLEKCLDLLEEGVRIANRCTELLDHTEWRSVVEEQEGPEAEEQEGPEAEGEAEGAEAVEEEVEGPEEAEGAESGEPDEDAGDADEAEEADEASDEGPEAG